MMKYEFVTDRIKIGKKGQITLPKKLRDEDNLKEDDVLIVTHMPGGDILLTKSTVQKPEDMMFAAIANAPHFDWRKAWDEVKEERRKDR